MKIIAVTGGKGGTGKSTVAIFLAKKMVDAGKHVVLVDADVECPNDFILLGTGELSDAVKEVHVSYPVLDDSACSRCGTCVRECRANAIIAQKDGTPVFNHDLCTSCGVCWHICPENAIDTRQESVGEIFEDTVSDKLTLVTGRSHVGVRETSSVVEPLREYAASLRGDVMIIDTAAGSHCTVMRALEGAEHAYAVTEPTPLGRHDVKVILNVLKELEIPSSIILNQHDVGDEGIITDVAGEFDTDISGRIPYSTELAKKYAAGALLEFDGIEEIFEFDREL